MPDVVIVGSIGIDAIKTPFGTAKDILGGSAIYASFAASFSASAGVISVKGNDLADSELEFLRKRNVDLRGVQSKGKNFRWSGEYEYDMNEAKTISTELNSISGFTPVIPEEYKKAKYLFLANIDPAIQIEAMEAMEAPKLVVLDTMNLWISTKKELLLKVIKKTNILILNESEARQLFKTPNIVKAAKYALSLGPWAVIIKKGEDGALLFTEKEVFSCPGYPLENVVDPTGCGDSFGGAFIGNYSKTKNLRKAIVYAAIIASFNAEGFGLSNLQKISKTDIKNRLAEMQKIRKF